MSTTKSAARPTSSEHQQRQDISFRKKVLSTEPSPSPSPSPSPTTTLATIHTTRRAGLDEIRKFKSEPLHSPRQQQEQQHFHQENQLQQHQPQVEASEARRKSLGERRKKRSDRTTALEPDTFQAYFPATHDEVLALQSPTIEGAAAQLILHRTENVDVVYLPAAQLEFHRTEHLDVVFVPAAATPEKAPSESSSPSL